MGIAALNPSYEVNPSYELHAHWRIRIRRYYRRSVAYPSCYIAIMNSSEVLETLRRSEAALRARGVRRAALFGSLARGDNQPDSDIDIMVEIDPAARITVFDYVGLKEYIAGLFDGPVDVVSRDNLKPYVRPAATADPIYAF
jgi:predicted nucleotidyltransferase